MKSFHDLKRASITIVDSEYNTEFNLSLDIRSPFVIVTRILPSVDSLSNELTTWVYDRVAFCVEIGLENVIEAVNEPHISLEGFPGVLKCELKKEEDLRWRFEVCMKRDKSRIDTASVLLEFSLAESKRVTFRQSLPPFILNPSPVTIEVVSAAEFEKGVPAMIRVQIRNQSNSTQKVAVKIRKDMKRWILAGVMEEEQIVVLSINLNL